MKFALCISCEHVECKNCKSNGSREKVTQQFYAKNAIRRSVHGKCRICKYKNRAYPYSIIHILVLGHSLSRDRNTESWFSQIIVFIQYIHSSIVCMHTFGADLVLSAYTTYFLPDVLKLQVPKIAYGAKLKGENSIRMTEAHRDIANPNVTILRQDSPSLGIILLKRLSWTHITAIQMFHRRIRGHLCSKKWPQLDFIWIYGDAEDAAAIENMTKSNRMWYKMHYIRKICISAIGIPK